jgi:hypothetical protein
MKEHIFAILDCFIGYFIALNLFNLKGVIHMNLSAFLNPIEKENKKVVVSDRFVENGKPVEWEIRTISEEKEEAIRKSCTIKKKGKNGAMEKELDENLFNAKMAVESIVYPDLQNAELQDHYNALGAEDLLKKMLTSGEYWSFVLFIQEFNGYGKTLDDMVDEAKN